MVIGAVPLFCIVEVEPLLLKANAAKGNVPPD
jgi:hypothetical protein